MNTATSLNDIADAFQQFGNDQMAAKRFQRTAKARTECDIRADVWLDAAKMLRDTQIDPELIRQLKWMVTAFPARFRREDWLELVGKIEAAFNVK